jgi:hypothetical protein
MPRAAFKRSTDASRRRFSAVNSRSLCGVALRSNVLRGDESGSPRQMQA